jgi:FkbM family methyltransferase
LSNVDLIFDIGMHEGEDTSFYLAKGFCVVALEANPSLVAAARDKFAESIASGALNIVHAALDRHDDEETTLYVNDDLPVWSSLARERAERHTYKARPVPVRTTTLHALIARFGTPHYLKCDIEGADSVCAAQLARLEEVPPFASFEASDIDVFVSLRSAGYSRFQLVDVDQTRHWDVKQPEAAREGKTIEWTFPEHSSGPFGRELPDEKWVDLRAALKRFLVYEELQMRSPELDLGWLDVHAARD